MDERVPTFSDEEEEEDLSLSEPVVKDVPKPKKPKALTQEKSKKRAIIAKKEEAERQRKARLEEALKQVSKASGRELSEKEKHSLIVEKADNILCEDLFGSLAQKNSVQVEENVLEGEDLMAGGDEGKDDDKNDTEKLAPGDPMEAVENALAQLSLKDEMKCIKLASLVSAAVNQSGNSTNVLQFMELMIKAVSQSLDSSQFKTLSSACNVQKNKKQKEEKVGNKKKKKKSTKKILKTQNDDAFIDCAGMEDYGDYAW